jgi:hypothetical protein
LSLDALLRQRRNPGVEVAPSVAANVALRLMQVHTCIMFVMMAHAKMFGNVWWNGEGIWWLNFNNRGKVVDLASLGEKPMGRYLINAWTHVQVFYELSFPVLVWAPLARPLWLGLGALVWLAFALASGFFTLAVVMTVATLTFVSAEQWRALAGRAPLA